MPRTYARKKETTYNDSVMQLAISEVKTGRTIIAASRKYEIPYETLRRWIHCPPARKGSGRRNVLSTEEEKCIVVSLKSLAHCGFPFDRQDMITVAQEYIKGNSVKFNRTVGVEWAKGFERRWSNQLTKIKSESLIKDRSADLSSDAVDEFFEVYSNILEKNNLLNAPERIFNLEEVGLGTNSLAREIFVPRQSRNAYVGSPDAEKAMYSVLFCTSATGKFLPPFTVHKSLPMFQSWTKGGPPGALHGCTKSEWMQYSIFESWMSHFIKYVKDIKKPVLLLFDRHGSHLAYNIIKTAMDNEVIILCLPHNTSHALQPLDVGVFAPMKRAWEQNLKRWYIETKLQKVTKATFPLLLKQLLGDLKKENAVRGFEGAGLYPINRKVMQHRMLTDKYVPSVSDFSSYSTKAFLSDSPSSTAVLPSPSSCLNLAVLPDPKSVKDANYKTSKFPSLVSSTFTDLKPVISTTFFPNQPAVTKTFQNARKKRNKSGENLTEKEALKPVYSEEIHQGNKKKRN